MADDLIERLRAGLEGVTPGPWTWGQKYVCRRVGDKYIRLFNTPDDKQALEGSQWETDAAHVARCDPDTIRALLDALASKDKALEEMRAERDDAIAMVKLLQQQFKQQNDHDTALLERMADCLDCARMDWEVNNGEIINKADPHWTVEARRLCAALAQAEGETP